MNTLNKERRAHIVDSVIEKGTTIPKRKEALTKATCAKVREVLRKRLPKGFESVSSAVPDGWLRVMTDVSVHRDANPLSIIKGHYHCTYQNISFEPLRVPSSINIEPACLQKKGKADETDDCWELILANEIKEAHNIADTEEKLRDELMGFLLSVKTFKQVRERMPELEPHLPKKPVKTYPVVASTTPLLNLLTAVGFDQAKEEVT